MEAYLKRATNKEAALRPGVCDVLVGRDSKSLGFGRPRRACLAGHHVCPCGDGRLAQERDSSLRSPHGGDAIEEERVRVWRKKCPAGFRKGWGLRLGRMETAGYV